LTRKATSLSQTAPVTRELYNKEFQMEMEKSFTPMGAFTMVNGGVEILMVREH
jgi:hypothetical protein